MIQIRKSQTADTRTCDFANTDKATLLASSPEWLGGPLARYRHAEAKSAESPKQWNRCDVCGRFISMSDFDNGKAVRRMTVPDSDYSTEDYETLCHQHRDEVVKVKA